MPAVGSDGERGANFNGAIGSFCPDPRHTTAFFDQFSSLGLHSDSKAGVALALLHKKVKKIPLRHESEKLAVSGKTSKIGDLDDGIANLPGEFPDFLMRPL